MWNKKQKLGVVIFVVIHALAVLARAQTNPVETFAALQKYVQSYNAGIEYENQKGVHDLIKLEKVPRIASGEATALQTHFSAEGLTYVLQYTNRALQNPELLAKNLIILEVLKPRWAAKTILFFAETNYNAEHGNVAALYRRTVQNLAFLSTPSANAQIEVLLANGNEELLAKIKEALRIEKENLKAQEKELLEKAQKVEKAQYKELEKYRSESGLLTKYEDQEEKLNDLLLKNDRKGVRKMLEAYLPWQVMEPLEVQAWKTWLEAIEHPHPTKTVVALRGLSYDTDKVQRLKLPNGQERVAFFSTVLSKNQGSYTRRLRSLTTNREKNGKLGEQVPGVQLANQLKRHAGNPHASSFLSFTLSSTIANDFTGHDKAVVKDGVTRYVSNGGLLAVRMDERRLLPNVVSGYNEAELLAALVVFPDEVVKFHDGSFYKRDAQGNLTHDVNAFNDFYAEVAKKTGVDFLKNASEINDRYLDIARNFFHTAEQMPTSNMCSKVFP